MGRRKLCTGMIIGAIVGGLVTLTNQEARDYTRNKLCATTSQIKHCLKNPAESVRNARICVTEFNKNFASGAENAVNALEQVEQTLEKVVRKND